MRATALNHNNLVGLGNKNSTMHYECKIPHEEPQCFSTISLSTLFHTPYAIGTHVHTRLIGHPVIIK